MYRVKIMDVNLAKLFMVEPIHGGSVNGWIQIPPSFTLMIYYVIISVMTAGAVLFVVKKTPLLQALRKSIVIAFFCAGFLYLAFSERTWYSWFTTDCKNYSGYSTEGKEKIFLGPVYDFLHDARQILKDEDYVIYYKDVTTGLMVQYHLLPRRNRAKAKNVIVLYDNKVAYDDRKKIFIRGDTREEVAEILAHFDTGAYILRIK